MTSLVNNKYRITRRIGGGSFGEIYMGVGPNGEKVAVKFERNETRCPQLRHEYKVYRELTGCHGFCQVYHFGQQDNYNVMVMDLLGPSLEDLFNKCNRRFSLKTVLQIADQMLERVDTLHSRHLIHRDIKPANFVIGVGDQAATIFCVDFGLSKRYRHPKNLQHIPHRDGRSLTGTPRYASINNHLGIEQSRRDDLESIGYVLIYFLKGTLPWQGLKAKNAQKKYRLILEKKQQVSIAQLCQGCPSQFAEFLAYTRSLKFDAKPDIPYLRKLFRDLYHAQNCGASPKLWDWDGMDNDFSSTTGSNNGGAPPAISSAVPPALGLRPTTAAAVAGAHHGGGGGADADLMGVGEADGFDEEMDAHRGGAGGGGDRPTTAGAMMQYGRAPVPSGGANGNTWGYTRSSGDAAASGGMLLRSAAGGGGGADLGDPAARARPHTAHAGRAAQPGGYPPQQGGAMMQAGYSEADEHVVAGARDMMRYRRSRAADGVPPGAQPQPMQMQQPAYGAPPNNTPWAYYQGAGKPTGAPMPVQQQQQPQRQSSGMGMNAMAAQSGGGWSSAFAADTRPKSATNGMPSSRPSSSTQPPLTQAQVAQQQQQQQWAPAPNATSSTPSLSYGSLKNRFLSGSTAKTNSSGQPTGASASSAANNGKSKLFSLAR